MTRNENLAELALCFVGLFLGLAAFGIDPPASFVFSLSGLALSITMLVRITRRRRAGR